MEIVPSLTNERRCLCDIRIYPYLRDHHLEGKVILPAVESLIVLAQAVKTNYPQVKMNCLRNAAFSRFLMIAPDSSYQSVIVDLKNVGNDGIAASLSTSIKSKTSKISREVEHARVNFFSADSQKNCTPPFATVNKLKGNCISIPSATVYKELVPFGVSYQNIVGDLLISPEGALACISGGNNEADEIPLGSPFPLDATMHAACVWGQRFAGKVCFPVGFKKRVIYEKTKKGEKYLGRVIPVNITKEMLIFDAWIYDKDDVVCESISGIQMKDVTRGRMHPPDWLKA